MEINYAPRIRVYITILFSDHDQEVKSIFLTPTRELIDFTSAVEKSMCGQCIEFERVGTWTSIVWQDYLETKINHLMSVKMEMIQISDTYTILDLQSDCQGVTEPYTVQNT